MAVLRNVMFLCVFALSVNSISSKTLRNALLIDVEVEYQRGTWLTVDIKKSSSAKGSYNFKFNFHVRENAKDVTIDIQKWPLFPIKLPDNTFLNMSTTDNICGFIKEDYFYLFSKGNFSKACAPGKKVLLKGNYTFEYNIDKSELSYQRDIGTAIQYFLIYHGGGPVIVIKMLVDTNIIAVEEYEETRRVETHRLFQYRKLLENIGINLV